MAFSLDVSNESHVCYLYGSAVLSSAFQFTSMSRSRVTTIGDWRCSFFLGMAAMKTSQTQHLEMLSHPILPFKKVNLSIIPYNFTTHPIFQNFIFFPILFKYSILFIYFFFYYFSFSIPFSLFLPQPLAPISTHKATHT